MLQYLTENKEWIFSGIGVFLLTGILGLIKFALNRKKIQPQQTSMPIVVPESTPEGTETIISDNRIIPEVSNITVKLIIDEINNSPPFQRNSVARNYLGIYVRWEGSLWEVKKLHTTTKGTQDVEVIIFTNPENLHYRAIFKVNIDKYPNLKIAKRDSFVIVEGTIIHCSGEGMYVELDPKDLKINH